jgi:hypothetical protein
VGRGVFELMARRFERRLWLWLGFVGRFLATRLLRRFDSS